MTAPLPRPCPGPLGNPIFDLPTMPSPLATVVTTSAVELMATLPLRLHPEALVAYGDPAEELAKVARDRHAGLVVMGLHGSPLLGPRMGSVTYRMLCLSPGLVLALPPGWAFRGTGTHDRADSGRVDGMETSATVPPPGRSCNATVPS